MANLRVPPHNEEAEQSVLGALLIDKDAMNIVSEFIGPSDFYSEINKIIFDAMVSLYEERKPIDLVTLTTKLKKAKDKLSAHDILILFADADVDMAAVATLEPRTVVFYGQGAKKITSDGVVKSSKYVTTKEKLPEKMETIILASS